MLTPRKLIYPINDRTERMLKQYAPDVLHQGGRAAPDWACVTIDAFCSCNSAISTIPIDQLLQKVQARPMLQSAIVGGYTLHMVGFELVLMIQDWTGF